MAPGTTRPRSQRPRRSKTTSRSGTASGSPVNSNGWRSGAARQTQRLGGYAVGSGAPPIELGRGPGAWPATGSVAQQQSARPQTSIRIPPRATLQPQSAHSICDLLYPRFDPTTHGCSASAGLATMAEHGWTWQPRAFQWRIKMTAGSLLSWMMVSSSAVPSIAIHLTFLLKRDARPRQNL